MRLFEILPRSGWPLDIAQLSGTVQQAVNGDPGRIRTCNPQSRNLMLYPVELRDRRSLISTGNMKNPLRSQAGSNRNPGWRDQGGRWTVHLGVRPQRDPPAPGPGHRDCFGNFACDFLGCPLGRHQSVTFSRIFVPSRGVRPRPRSSHHDRFGSRRSTLRNAGAWPQSRPRPPTRPSNATISPIPRSSWKPRSRREAGPVAKTTATLKTDADAAFRRNDFRTGLATARPDRRHRARGQRQLAATGAHHLPDPPRQLDRADLPARARLDRRLHRLSARRQRRRGGRCAGRARPRHGRPQAVAAGAGCAADVARHARGRRCPRPVREDCATSTASGCSTTPWIPTAPRRAPASSSPRISPSASTSRPSSRWPAPTSRRCRPKASSFASRG